MVVCSLAPAYPSVYWLSCAQAHGKQHSPGGINDAAGRGLHCTVHVDNRDEHGSKAPLQLVLGPVQCQDAPTQLTHASSHPPGCWPVTQHWIPGFKVLPRSERQLETE